MVECFGRCNKWNVPKLKATEIVDSTTNKVYYSTLHKWIERFFHYLSNMVEQIIYRKKNDQKPKFEGVLLG